MQPHDRAHPFDARGFSALRPDDGGPPGISGAPRAPGAPGVPVALGGRPPVPDAFCCVHPLALEQPQQQGSGDWRLRATSKAIRSDSDLRRWLSSSTHSQFLAFVGRLAKHAAGKKSLPSLLRADVASRKITEPAVAASGAASQAQAAGASAAAPAASACDGLGSRIRTFVPFGELPANNVCWAMLRVLQQLLQWVQDIPPVEQPTRFGNQAFKTWCRKLEEEALDLLAPVWTSSGTEISETAKMELTDIFCSSFGNPVRLDFGTGHECSFAIFLFCLFKLKLLEEDTHDPFAVLGIFKGYVEVAHALQQRYMLEAAGSRGVWGLDDFHFLTFLWGAGQLSEQQIIEPDQITERDLVQQLAPDLLYFDSIQYVLQTKKGAPFFECSPILYDVSGISSWKKICAGLIRMYEGEVLCKLPIVQHFLFGTVFPLTK
ncbi:phosphotyrosyl phosphatase activator, putative [Eimeria necatrix]|uniref:Serine/threonine-protein phosphatase 2A activator n=1 Tax=Eimeria necatrix TaxID=51315 RepID=U6MU13_9EIME|nr:phosphotyrosyl phosphatase activator, putative [Eimeria necatrix]CDJ66543.1 phosphotyrosyl phosphatase activator, putative [Eimeria necatrix]